MNRSKTIARINWFILFLATFVLLSMHFYKGIIRLNIPGYQYCFFAVTLFSLLLSICTAKKIKFAYFLPRSLPLLILMLFIVCAISAMIGMTPHAGLRLVVIIFITSLPFMLAGKNSVDSPAAYVIPMLVFGLFVIIGTLVTAYGGPIKIGAFTFSNYLWGTRWSFWFNQANGLGVIMALTLSSLMYGLLIVRKEFLKIAFFLIFITLAFFILLKTGSRSALAWGWSSLWLTIFVMIYKNQTLRQNSNYLLCGLFLVLFLLSIYFCMHYLHIVRQDVSGSVSIQNWTSTRWAVWQDSFKQIKIHPFFGYGFGSEEMFLHFRPNVITGNVYIRLLSESGIFSLLIFLILLASSFLIAFTKSMELWYSRPGLSRYAFFLCLCLLGLGLEQMGDAFILRVEELNYLFFFLVFAAWSLRDVHGK